MKYRPLIINDDLFGWKIRVYRGMPIEEFIKIITNDYTISNIDRLTDEEGCVIKCDGVLLLWTRCKSIPLLIHEVTHAAIYAMENIMQLEGNLVITPFVSEVLSLYEEMIVRKVLEKGGGK